MAGTDPNVSQPSGTRAAAPEADTRAHLRRLGLRAVKGLGQHFLIDRDVLGKILAAAEIQPHDVVVEVGPGLGILTAELATRAQKVLAVEVDFKLAEALQSQLSSAPEVTVLHADILQIDPAELVPAGKTAGDPQAYKVVANLPYYVASPIIRHFFEASAKPTIMVVMLQKEVAQSVVAGPGHMSLLGIGVQLYGRPEIVDYVPARSFYPRPKVDSAIVRIDVYDRPAIGMQQVRGFFDVVRAGFSAPRKQLRNSLSVGLKIPPAEIDAILGDVGIASQRRPQTLSLDEWARVHTALAGRR